MEDKLKCILLIDDDEPTNYLNKLILREMDCAERVEVAQSGREAIHYLTTPSRSEEIKEWEMPDLVFLDINMPAMDGWEFLDLYNVFNSNRKKKAVTIMLTTSLNPDDEIKSQTFTQVNGFRKKPLSKQMMQEILEEYFPTLTRGAA